MFIGFVRMCSVAGYYSLSWIVFLLISYIYIMSQKTEQLLFCVYCVVFIIIALFTELDFLIFGFPGLLLLLFWISRLMKLVRENKS